VDDFASSFIRLLPSGFAAAACPIDSVDAGQVLLGIENDNAANYSPSRRREFAAGRLAARTALQRLGLPPAAIPAGADRAPVWPEGIAGSITHAGGIALAAAGRAGPVKVLGIDMERCGTVNNAMAALILTAGDDPDYDPTLLFSIKESVFKCLYRRQQRIIDYTEVVVRVDGKTGRFEVRPSAAALQPFSPVSGNFDQASGFWRSACYLTQ
jgi:4'-phosphopantetheinyl transferase EntD